MQSQPGGVEALLFDLDGTLIDSMPQHHESWVTWHRRHGLHFDAQTFFAATAGRANVEILAKLMPGASADELAALGEEKEAIYRELAAETLQLVPGAEALVRQARERGLRLAICTASTPLNMALAFRRFGLDQWVDTIVSPADGLRGKPHPDIFLEAARRLGVAAAASLVFEDAPLGIEAAQRAAMRAVAITTSMDAAAFAAFQNVVGIYPDLDGIDLAGLGATRPGAPSS
jgi:beta-phosphoglucomutase